MKARQGFVATLLVAFSFVAYSGDVIQYWIDQTSIFINRTIGGLQTPATCWSFAVAVSDAAHNSLGWLFHGYRLSPYIDEALKTIQTEILATDSISLANAISTGQQTAKDVITNKSNDGLNNFVNYTFGPAKPGIYQLTLTGYGLPPDGPQVPFMKPYANNKPASTYLAPLPPQVTDPSYENNLASSKAIRSVHSTSRTPDQTDIALFWREGAPIKWNRITNVLVGTSLSKDVQTAAKLRTQLNYAMFNAAVASWVSKFHYNTWRPETALHRTDIWLPSGHNISDPNWKALINPTAVEQEYTSGHATTGGAAATVLKAYNGGDNVSISVSSLVTQDPTHVSTRDFTNLTVVGVGISYSIVFGGIHFTFTADTSFKIGTQVALDTLATFDQLWSGF